MILDVIDTGPEPVIGILLFPIVIILFFVTIGRFITYMKNHNKKAKIQSIVLLAITIILTITMVYLFFYTHPYKPNGGGWRAVTEDYDE